MFTKLAVVDKIRSEDNLHWLKLVSELRAKSNSNYPDVTEDANNKKIVTLETLIKEFECFNVPAFDNDEPIY